MTRELLSYNSLGVPSTADELRVVSSEQELAELITRTYETDRPLTVLGGGTNVVLHKRVRGLVIILALKGVHIQSGYFGEVEVTAAAGELWHPLVQHTLERGLYGLENLALIPGTVGAAPIQNIGAYGVELSERFISLRAMDRRDATVRRFDSSDCRFGYRDSRFKFAGESSENSSEEDRYIILDVTLSLSKQAKPVLSYPDIRDELAQLGFSRPTPLQVAQAVIRVRQRKLPDPKICGNVGSVFKNPLVDEKFARDLKTREPELNVRDHIERRDQLERRDQIEGHGDVERHGVDNNLVKLSAAQLIDLCGFKGEQRGPVGVWQRQPLVFVNLGSATGADFLALAEEVQRAVFQRFQVSLQMEPKVLGEA